MHDVEHGDVLDRCCVLGRRTSLEVEPRGSSHVGRAPVDTHNAGRHACLERCVFDCGDLNTCCAYVALTCRTVWKVLFPCCTALGLLHILSPPSTVHLHGTAFLLRPLGYLVITLPQPLALVKTEDGVIKRNANGNGGVLLYNTHGLGHAPEGTRVPARGRREQRTRWDPPRTTHANPSKRKLKRGAAMCLIVTVYSLQTCSARRRCEAARAACWGAMLCS